MSTEPGSPLHSYLEPTTAADPDADLPQRPGWVRRYRWVFALLLLVAWLLVGGGGGQFAGKLSQVQKNDTSSFLPADAESFRASQLLTKFATEQTFPAFLLVDSDSALEPGQLAAVQKFAQGIPAIEIPVAGSPRSRSGTTSRRGRSR